ncbi:methyltransferase [Angomonas deanei]|uniref:16S rRNA methyltransferase RsmB/F, putative n=1 Tax=Angomonas deanei TaxID=59799 RepID=A0A7G2CVH6_9TRYP|nr:methyltransferase [Angomonas deanei]CAD2222312.1 16S rRNA methyltransferase RsmB/F, putative [Angomonas deanei]|eukprot:EPY28021.1 methyltransferase [Angomonas deanei]
MKKRDAKRKRERESLPPILFKLIELLGPQQENPRQFLVEQYLASSPDDERGEDAIISGEGLQKLVEALGKEVCPTGSKDLLTITRRVPHSRSTPEGVLVSELCFALSQATGPVTVHERRKAEGASAGPLDETSPLLQYYKGRRFRAIIKGEDPSSPAARQMAEEGSEEAKAADEEWRQFVEALSTPLPMTLRIHRNERVLEDTALRVFSPDAPHPLPLGKVCQPVVKPVTCMPPQVHLYSCSNRDYHGNPDVESACRVLHASSAVSFQEVVSAIPVVVLDPQSHHTVLEMCAAPGSKTLQSLDRMLQDGWTAAVSKGVFISNEKDRVKATQTLPARLKRYHAPNAVCTRCDGTQWPRLYDTRLFASDTWVPEERRFDRVLCDVPCSGDGTLRKGRAVATTWSAGYVKSLVPTQKALLRRGLDLLEVGGVLVYSTCSLNPKEDEEVVCGALEQFGEFVELIDVNAILKEKGAQLHSQGGILSPNVESLMNPVVPPSYDGSKVLRVLPHRDNTGGFFVAAFRKVKLVEDNHSKAAVILKHRLNQWTKGKLWAPVEKEDPHWVNIAGFYKFDRFQKGKFVYWSDISGGEVEEDGGLVPVFHLNPHGGPTRRIVLVTQGVAKMIFSTQPYKGPGLEIVSMGVRAFEGYDGKFLTQAACRWRAVVESASFFAPSSSAENCF